MTRTKYMAIAEHRETNTRTPILPRSRKTGLFTSLSAAQTALDKFGRRMEADGWRGLIYQTPHNPDSAPCHYMAI